MTDLVAVNVDHVAGQVDIVRQAREWDRIAKDARLVVLDALRGWHIGLIRGRPAVKVTTIRQSRVDIDRLREAYPDVYSACTVEIESERLDLIDETD